MHKLENSVNSLAHETLFASFAERATLHPDGNDGDDGAIGYLIELEVFDASYLYVEPVLSLLIKHSGVYLTAALNDGRQIHADDKPRTLEKRARCISYAQTSPVYAALELLERAIAREIRNER
jgi:hypothetical protein